MKDLKGKRFGRLVVLAKDKIPKPGLIHWLCKCDCGNTKVIRGCSLTNGVTTSCGCYRIELGKAKQVIFNIPEYVSYTGMLYRCYNPNKRGYNNYGGRGITVCDRWRTSFKNFLKDMGTKPTPKHTLDRKENDGNYEPSNCRWATRSEQQFNRRPWDEARRQRHKIRMAVQNKRLGIEKYFRNWLDGQQT